MEDPVITEIKALQKLLGVTADGVFGPVSQAALAAHFSFKSTPPVGSDDLAWRAWFKARMGWTEFNHDKELSLGWKLCNLDYTTVIGAEHAWCGMSLATALHASGYLIPKSAAWAPAWDKYGVSIDWKNKGIPLGAIVRIQHAANSAGVKGAHVTTANRLHLPGEKILEALGGNQHDSINITVFNVSGNASGHDEIIHVCMPIKA